jgi:hypothetical protein
MHSLQMSEDAVLNWDAIVHKNVRSKDGQAAGNVDAIEGNTVVITSGKTAKNTMYQNLR